MARLSLALALVLTLVSCGSRQFCNATTCSGCCSPEGVCELGQSDDACGARGEFCFTCSMGKTCQAGACVLTSATGGGSASNGGGTATAGGSEAGGAGGGSGAAGGTGGAAGGTSGTAGGTSGTAGGTSGTAGGTSGTAGGTSGTAGGTSGTAGGTGGTAGGGGAGGGSASSCNALTCPTGCCLAGVCMPGADLFACGIGGAACSTCVGLCFAGQCVGLTGGGGDGGTGAPCGQSAQCSAEFLETANCISERRSDGGFSGWPAGYCASTCSLLGLCPSGGTCLNNGYCYAPCTNPGQGRGVCRQGYVCTGLVYTDGGVVPNEGICSPDCRNLGAGCIAGYTCNAQGHCQ